MSKVQTINRSGLIGEFLLDGNTLDTNDGTKYNGTSSNVTYESTDRGYQNQTGLFNGSSSKVDITVTPFASLEDCSICAWVYLNGYGGGNAGHVFDARGTNNFILDSTNVNYAFYAGTGSINVASPLALGKWHFLTGVRSGTNLTLYKDCVSVATGTTSGTVTPTSARIGNEYNDGADRHFNGKIQGLRIYNRAISIQEMQSLYMEGLRKLGGFGLAPLTDGLIAYYDFNGDANDIIGGNNGTLTNAPTISTDQLGMSNRAYSFNGSSNYITLPSATMNNLPAGSISVWVKRGAVNSQESFFDKLQTGVSNHIQFMYENSATSNKIRWRINDQTLASAVGVTDTNWHHWVGTFSVSGMNLYKDGVLENSNATNAQLANYSANITVGQVIGVAYLAGSLADVMCFNRVLSASEVLALYKLSSTRYLTPLLH